MRTTNQVEMSTKVDDIFKFLSANKLLKLQFGLCVTD